MDYIINLHLPVLIYILSNAIILTVQSFYIKDKTNLVRYISIAIVATFFLQFLCNQEYRKTVWFIVLAPYITIFFMACTLLYLFVFYVDNGQTLGQKINNAKAILAMHWHIRQDNSISIFNEMRTLFNI